MKKLFACFAIALIWSCTEKKDVQKEVQKEVEITKIPDQYSIKQMMDNEAISGGSFYRDNSKLLVSSNRSGIYNMYTVPANGGELTPITQSDSASIFAISYFPRDERMLFSMDGNGDEIYHIYIRNLNGSHTDLTPAKGARASFHGWAEDNQSFFFTSNKRDSKYMDLYQMDFLDYSPKLIFKNEEGYDIGNLSKDQKYLTLTKSLNTNDSDLYLYNLSSKKKIKINKTQSANSSQDFSPSGDELYYTTDEGIFWVATLPKMAPT